MWEGEYWEREYGEREYRGVPAQGLRDEARFSNEEFPRKGNQGSPKHSGGNAISMGVPITKG